MVQPDIKRERELCGGDTKTWHRSKHFTYPREKANHCYKSMPVYEAHLLVKFIREEFALLQGKCVEQLHLKQFCAVLTHINQEFSLCCYCSWGSAHAVLWESTVSSPRSLMIKPSEGKIYHKTVKNQCNCCRTISIPHAYSAAAWKCYLPWNLTCKRN